MEYQEFSTIYNALNSISSNNDLNKDDVIKAVKNKLSSDSDAYKEWEKGKFSFDHVFTTVNNGVESKHTLLTAAFNREDSKVANFLIKVGADVNAVGVDGLTPLIIAIEKEYGDPKHKELVDLLIGKVDAHVSAADENVNNTIVKAVERGNLRVFKALKEAGANVNIQANGMSLLKWAEFHQPDSRIKKEDMEEIINTLKAPSKEKGQKGVKSTGGQTPVNGGNANTQSTTDNTTPENNDTTFWSEHKGKIALGVTGLCVAGAVAAYVLAYPTVALALAVLAAVILMGAGIAKVLEDPSVEKPFTQQQKA